MRRLRSLKTEKSDPGVGRLCHDDLARIGLQGGSGFGPTPGSDVSGRVKVETIGIRGRPTQYKISWKLRDRQSGRRDKAS
jgi:hypothetical protein